MITKWLFATIDTAPAASLTILSPPKAILPIAGEKTINHRFYERFVRLADGFNDEHLNELSEEGVIQ